MKKFIICAAVVLAAGLMVSCEEEATCWVLSDGERTEAFWGTEAEVEAYIEEDWSGTVYYQEVEDVSESSCDY